MSVPIEKIHKELAKALHGTAMVSGHGKVSGVCTGAVPTKSGLQVYIQFDEKALPGLPDRGFSFEIPLWQFLPEGKVAVCPSAAGRYEVSLSNDAVITADYDPVGSKWTIPGQSNPVGEMHAIKLPDWKHPAVVVGIKMLAQFHPGLKVHVVEEEVAMPEVAADNPGKS